eukprot:GEMP01047938.1.p1 GENE.GEMP01047938.1~~GEMP01047938.1.p1  ORF type:complete len:248 (+),score=54.21 GEMP01047938.1:179-922(+)
MRAAGMTGVFAPSTAKGWSKGSNMAVKRVVSVSTGVLKGSAKGSLSKGASPSTLKGSTKGFSTLAPKWSIKGRSSLATKGKGKGIAPFIAPKGLKETTARIVKPLPTKTAVSVGTGRVKKSVVFTGTKTVTVSTGGVKLKSATAPSAVGSRVVTKHVLKNPSKLPLTSHQKTPVASQIRTQSFRPAQLAPTKRVMMSTAGSFTPKRPLTTHNKFTKHTAKNSNAAPVRMITISSGGVQKQLPARPGF